MSMRKLTKKQAIKLATEDYYKTKKHNYVFNVPAHPQMGYSFARRGEIAGKGIREVWDTSKLWKPIYMDIPLVAASFAGDKTEIRRLVKRSQIHSHFGDEVVYGYKPKDVDVDDQDNLYLSGNENGIRHKVYVTAPYKPGDLLYVRERWQKYCNYGVLGDKITYSGEVDESREGFFNWYFIFPDEIPTGHRHPDRWLPSIHMPKKASRLWLEVAKCYPQFLQDITLDQVVAEGVTEAYPKEFKALEWNGVTDFGIQFFAHIWDEIAGKDGVKSDDNPLVWVTEYKRVDYGPFVNGGK